LFQMAAASQNSASAYSSLEGGNESPGSFFLVRSSPEGRGSEGTGTCSLNELPHEWQYFAASVTAAPHCEQNFFAIAPVNSHRGQVTTAESVQGYPQILEYRRNQVANPPNL